MAVKNLHQIYPALHYVAGGTLLPVALTYTDDNGKILPLQISSVLITYTDAPTLVITEISNYVTGAIPVTKISNPQTGNFVYVAEYINDVLPWLNCCPADDAIGSTFSFKSNKSVIGFGLSEEGIYIVDWGNGNIDTGIASNTATVSTTTPRDANIAIKVYITSDPTKLQFINFNNNNDVTTVVGSISSLAALSGLRTFICQRASLAALPALPATLTTLNVWDNDLTAVTLPASLSTLDVRNNQLTALPAIPAGVNDAQAQNNNLTVTAVNNVLTQLNTNNLNNGFLTIQSQTPTATPSGGGASAKTALIGKGWSVTTD